MPSNPPRSSAVHAPAETPPPPRSGVGVVGRERLLARLLEARRLPCIVVSGPAGAGKSTLIAAWRQALMPLGFDVAWFTAAADDDRPARFLDRLMAALAQVDPALVRDAATLHDDGVDPDAAERSAITLVRGVAARAQELLLVLDDLHHLRHPLIHDALQWLLEYAPPNLHLVLVSRAAPPLSMERLRSQSRTLELDLRDLRFTRAETQQYLQAQIGDVDARTVKTLHEWSDGWVTGLKIFTLDWKKKQLEAGRAAPGKPFAGLPARDAGALIDYFEREVLSRLSADELAILVRAASCNRFCASLCAALLGTPDAVGPSAALMDRLESEALFVVPVEGRSAEVWLRLHPLLREALLARFAALDEAARQAVHARACAWFRDRGMVEDAVRHAVQAGEPAQAAALVEQCAQSLLVRGERRELIALLQQLPPEQIAGSFRMRLWLARTQLHQRDLQACEKILDGLACDLPADDTGARFLAATLRAALAVRRDDSDAALALLPQLLEAPPNADAIAIGGRNNVLSWLYNQQGAYEKARNVQLAAPALTIDGMPLVATAAGSLHGRCLVGLSYALEGRMTQAERIYRAVAAQARQGGKGCVDSYYLAIGLLGDVLYEVDDVRQARELLEDKVDMLERIAIPDAVMRAFRLLTGASWQIGKRQEAFAHVQRLEDYAVRHGLDRLLAHSLGDRANLHLLLGETTAAEATLARLEVLERRHAGATSNATGEISEQAQRTRIRLAAAVGDLDGAAAQLGQLIAQCEARGRQRSVAHLLVKSAVVDARRGRHEAARQKLLDALRRGHRLGLLRSLLDADPMAPQLIGELAQTEPLDPVLAFYVERLQAARTRPKAPPAASQAKTGAPGELAEFSEREVEVLRLLAQAMPNKKIARALGLSPETVKWYLSRIYGKLRVAGRDAAVARVRDLGWDAEAFPSPG